MVSKILRFFYTWVYAFFLVFALPGYLIKMKRRGGFGTGLLERFGYYKIPLSEEPKGGLYVHAVSVGEVMIALKFIRGWKTANGGQVVLAVSTSTGHATAKSAEIKGLRVVYSPLDIPGLTTRCLKRFEPKVIALVEAELWPNFAASAQKLNIPMAMINARLSSRSEGRYRMVKPLSKFFYSALDAMGVQDKIDARRFVNIGVNPDIIHITGSIKFDQDSTEKPVRKPEYEEILNAVSGGKPIVLAASTHAGEEVFIARAIKKAGGFPVIVPRHAERRHEVYRELDQDGWQCILRTDRVLPKIVKENVCYIVDTTGELRDWTSLATIVVIGKSFFAIGGQNPAEAVAASVPVVAGPHMENFGGIVNLLAGVDGIAQCLPEQLVSVLSEMINNPLDAHAQASRAHIALKAHFGATMRSVKMVQALTVSEEDKPLLDQLV